MFAPFRCWNDKRPLPEYKTPNRIHYSRMLPKNSSRERSVSEVTGVGGIYRKPAYFSIQARSEIHVLRSYNRPHTSHSVRFTLCVPGCCSCGSSSGENRKAVMGDTTAQCIIKFPQIKPCGPNFQENCQFTPFGQCGENDM